MERTQFTFYESFYKALSRIRKDADRAKAYDAITRFALYGEEPDVDSLPDGAAIAFEVIRPNLEASQRKAEAGRKGGESKQKQTGSKAKQSGSKPKQSQAKRKQEKEQDKEQDKEQMLLPPIVPQGTFDLFWEAYPRKVGKEAARTAFKKLKGVSVETLIQAIENQKTCEQWQKENGRYIPNPATWLNQGRWEDEPVSISQPAEIDEGDLDWYLERRAGDA